MIKLMFRLVLNDTHYCFALFEDGNDIGCDSWLVSLELDNDGFYWYRRSTYRYGRRRAAMAWISSSKQTASSDKHLHNPKILSNTLAHSVLTFRLPVPSPTTLATSSAVNPTSSPPPSPAPTPSH